MLTVLGFVLRVQQKWVRHAYGVLSITESTVLYFYFGLNGAEVDLNKATLHSSHAHDQSKAPHEH